MIHARYDGLDFQRGLDPKEDIVRVLLHGYDPPRLRFGLGFGFRFRVRLGFGLGLVTFRLEGLGLPVVPCEIGLRASDRDDEEERVGEFFRSHGAAVGRRDRALHRVAQRLGIG